MKEPASQRIARQDHPLSRKLISPNALKVLYRLRDNGHIAYLVGGGVRDILLGREPKDFDIATSATPGEVKRIFRNCRLVGRRFRLAHLHFRDEIIEVATFRANRPDEEPVESEAATLVVEAKPSHHERDDEGMILRDNIFGTPVEDAFRRDFTINALAYDIDDFSIVDHVGGVEDLRLGIIRTIGDPATRFAEDPVRMIRAIRFAALLGFRIEEESWQQIMAQAHLISRCAPPRLYEEVLKLFLCGEGRRVHELLRQSGLFDHLFPPLGQWLATEGEGFPHTRLGLVLEQLDILVAAGHRVSPPLLSALLFGNVLEEETQALLAAEGGPYQQTMDRVTAEFLSTLAPVVQIPARVVSGMRHILASQQRFKRCPGRRPQSFVTRPEFVDALEYLRIMEKLAGSAEKVAPWWDRYVAQLGAEPQQVAAEGGAAVATDQGKRRRRRRRRKPAAVTPSLNIF
jgi:poly(A) polymerase